MGLAAAEVGACHHQVTALDACGKAGIDGFEQVRNQFGGIGDPANRIFEGHHAFIERDGIAEYMRASATHDRCAHRTPPSDDRDESAPGSARQPATADAATVSGEAR